MVFGTLGVQVTWSLRLCLECVAGLYDLPMPNLSPNLGSMTQS